MTSARAGRYFSRSPQLEISLRLERIGSGELFLSGDANRQGSFLASFVSTAVSETAATGTVEAAVRFRGNADLDTGSVRLDIDERGLGSYQLSVDLQGGHRDFFAGELRWESSRFRKLRIEIDGLQNTLPPKQFQASHGAPVSIKSAFEAVGFDVTVEQDPFSWNGSFENGQRGWTPAEMHIAMEATRRAPEDNEFQVHVFIAGFMAGRGNRGVLGIMFDWGDADRNGRPREGVTVFHDHPLISDPRVPKAARDREYIFTAVHEIGHAMNLLHSFDKSRPAALSWMNYPQDYPFGYEASSEHDGTEEFWSAFQNQFDAEELLHLRHGSPREILPGGFSFGVYEEGLSTVFGGSAQPRRPAPGANPLRANRQVAVLLAPHRPRYELGEPVLMSLAVRNQGDEPAYIPNTLDPTEGYVRIEIRTPGGRIVAYRPPMRLCKSAAYIALRRNEELPGIHGLPIFLGADGPTFTEAGRYGVRAILTGINGRDIAVSDEAVVNIAHPTRSTEQFATQSWTNRRALEALYLRHPLVARDQWHVFEESIERLGIAKQRDNSTASYVNYVSGLGWMTPVADWRSRQTIGVSLEKAAARMGKADFKLLPGGAQKRAEMVVKLPSRRDGAPIVRTLGGILPLRTAEAVRALVPPSGLFGHIGLDRPKAGVGAPVDPTRRIVDALIGEPHFADIVSWNIEHLHDKKNWPKIANIAELIRSMRCDFWGLQEVDRDALEELVDVINSDGTINYAFDAIEGGGQQCGCLYRTDTVLVHRLDPPGDLFDEEIKVSLASGEKASRRVFFRKPYLADVRVRHGDELAYDFRCAVVHLKSTDNKLKDTGKSIRTRSSELLARWIDVEIAQSSEREYVVLGDMNAETAQQGLSGFSEHADLALLSVGMQQKYGTHNALTRVASKRLLDHVVVTNDAVAVMPPEDLGEQIVIRIDREIGAFTTEYSNHVPVAVRFIIGEDAD